MTLHIQHQDSYSRGELLLRTFFGWLYIGIPHGFLIYLYSFWVMILGIYSFFSILFTATMPRSFYEAYVGLNRWSVRFSASLLNLVDGYPPFGPNERWEKADFDIGYPERVTRKRLLYVVFLAWIALIPHMIILAVLSYAALFIVFISFFAVLFTGQYPEGMHKFVVGFLRWEARINMYMSMLYFKYPEFTFDETEIDQMHASKE